MSSVDPSVITIISPTGLGLGQQGVKVLGYYDRAYKLLLFPLAAVMYPLARVVIPILSRVQEDKERVRRIYLRIVGLLALATVPGMAAALAVPNEVILLVFGEKWLPVVPIFCWLGLAGLAQPINSTSGWLFISQNKAKEMFRWGLFASTTTVIAFLIGLHWGAIGVAAAYAISEYLVRLPCVYWYLDKISPVKAHDFSIIQFPLLGASFLTWVAVHILFQHKLDIHGPFLIVCAIIVSYIFAILFFALFRFNREILKELFEIGIKSVRNCLLFQKEPPL